MDLSIIIVNYNVEYFLQQCLLSVREATKNLQAEVFVVDNNSVDESVSLVKEKFPEVNLIANKENLGFSKANNQAIKIAKGRYVLLLNPDTVVEADTFTKTVAFMDSHPEAGGLGVRMLDGKGNFLPESKRGLPTPAAALFKMSGLSKLFPKNKKLAYYHQGHLNEFEINQVEILSGAFMLMRKEALDKTGYLDEDFFMYGEDIDLSYRILKAGYKNYYFPETNIIHYKGESTKKDSVNYVFVFYKAMIIFAKKHFSSHNAKILYLLINIAIVLRAFVALVSSFVKSVYLLLIDFFAIYIGLFFFSKMWGENFTNHTLGYPNTFLYLIIPMIVAIWILNMYYSGGYEKPIKTFKLIRGNVIGTLMILVIYSLLPETLRYSRAIILFGAIWSPAVIISYRLIFHFLGFKSFRFGSDIEKRIGIIGDIQEVERVEEILKYTYPNIGFVGYISSSKENNQDKYIGNINRIHDIISLYKINELIFCSKDVTPSQIISNMSKISNNDLEFKIAPSDSSFIVGANSINTVGDVYFVNINTINKPSNRRFKRLFDFAFSLILIILSPLLIWFYKNKFQFYKNMFSIFLSKKSFVGFVKIQDQKSKNNLPLIKASILSPSDLFPFNSLSQKEMMSLNLQYSRDYNLATDLKIVFKSWKKLDKMY